MSGDQQVVVYIGIGSNLRNPQQQVTEALTLLDEIPETVCLRASSLYRSRPMGPVDQPDYINAVAELKTTLPARMLLQHL
ncbi:MAG: 2-amino-4-hydroxy-6-hydroxymethyldihydropteridine diphosphokinase, partial [Gammaproteobacteria bacterium]|nr:2-amino-4-hydroxy-6-hydroxymethyldihydropteridine diphosphokinase [Gammaproteobacteria bacterium]